jgi:hypothetical protein
MGNRDKRGREKKKPKKQGIEKSRPKGPVTVIRQPMPPAPQPANPGSTESA